MSDTASGPDSAEGEGRQRGGWCLELILLLLVLASRPGPSVLLCAFYYIAGLLHAAMAWVFGLAVLLLPAAVLLAMTVRLVIWWSRARLLRRLVWIGVIVLSVTAMCVKRAPWVPGDLNAYVGEVLPAQRAYLYGFRPVVQRRIDVEEIRRWAREHRGLENTELSDAVGAGRVPISVKRLEPWSASVRADDSTAVFEGVMFWLNERWVLVVCQEDGRAPDVDTEVLPVAPGVWLTWAGERGAAP